MLNLSTKYNEKFHKKGTDGFPTLGEYENLCKNYQRINHTMLRALGMRESGIHVKSNGKLSG